MFTVLSRLGAMSMAVGIAAVASASFDLMLVPRAGGRIMRYDPLNRIALGDYGSSLVHRELILEGNSSWSFLSNGRFQRYNYSTGALEFNGAFGFGGNTSSYIRTAVDNQFLVTAGSSLFSVNAATGTATTIATLTAGVAYSQILFLPNGELALMGVDTATDDLVAERRTAAGALLQTVTTVETVTNDLLGQASLVTTVQGGLMLVHSYVSQVGGPNHRLRGIPIQVSGSFGTSITSTATGTGFSDANPNTVLACVPGHAGFWVVGPDSTSPASTARVMNMAAGTTFLASNDSFTFAADLPQSGHWSMANVVAPEPGTFLALGLPLIWALRKRTK